MSEVQIGQYFESFDGQKVFCREWECDEKPKAVFLIMHGMVEHCGRYEEFARFLNCKGYSVFAFDLRGHGQTAKSVETISQYDGDLFADCVQDAMFFADMLIKKYNKPLIVLGHSFGSFLLQSFVEQYHNHSLAIFSGSANMKGDATVGLGSVVAGITKFFCGKKAKCKMIYNLSFKAYGKPFANGNWLSTDEQNWIDYKKDPYCGAICSASFYSSFFKNLKLIYKRNLLENIDLDIPMLITSGEDDPVGGKKLDLTKKLVSLYKDEIGVEWVEFKPWEGKRHEILNETNKLEVWNYIENFCKEFLPKNSK